VKENVGRVAIVGTDKAGPQELKNSPRRRVKFVRKSKADQRWGEDNEKRARWGVTVSKVGGSGKGSGDALLGAWV